LSAPVRRILIIRLSAVGDCIHVMPALHALRQTLPDAFIAWAVEDRAAAVLQGNPDLNELIVIPRGDWKRRKLSWFEQWREFKPIRQHLRDLRFDAAIDFQGLTKSGLVAWASGAPRRIGFAGRLPVFRPFLRAARRLLLGSRSAPRRDRRPEGARELNLLFTNERIAPPPWALHVIDRNNALLSALGISVVEPRFQFPVRQAERAAVDSFLAEAGLSRRPYAVINPCGSWETKYWPAERFGRVAAWLRRDEDLPSVVVWHGEREMREAKQAAEASDGSAVLAPATTLGELAALMTQAALYVGLETGPTHMAAGLGVPCVCLVGPSSPDRNGPYGRPRTGSHQVVELGPKELACARCWLRRGCPNGLRCMMEITPERVLAAARRAIAGCGNIEAACRASGQG
jgi:heptosyltransferase I